MIPNEDEYQIKMKPMKNNSIDVTKLKKEYQVKKNTTDTNDTK